MSPASESAPDPENAARARADVVARGALLGAAACALAACLDVASSIGWLASRQDQTRLAWLLPTIGAAVGAAVGALASTWMAFGLPRGSSIAKIALRATLIVAPPLAAVALALFTGGRARRLPALFLLRPLAFVTMTGAMFLVFASSAHIVAIARTSGTRTRRVIVAAYVALALVVHALDHRILPRLYEYLHAGLGGATALALAGALASASPRLLPRMPRIGWLALLVSPFALALAIHRLDGWENVRAEVFGVHAPFVRHLMVGVERLRGPRDPLALASRDVRRARFERERRAAQTHERLPSLAGAHVLLLTIDALRADRLGAYGRSPSTTPTLDALAARGVLFEHAYSQAPHSSYSISSLHTGEYLHETVALGEPQPIPTIADRFASSGYRTVALYTNGIFFTEGERLTVYRDRAFGFARSDHENRRANAQADMAMREIDEIVRRGEPPSLVWVHFFDTHEPYGGEGSSASRRYDAAASHVDAAIGRLLAYARRRLARNLVVVVTADHGEEFGEHGGVYHGSSLYEEQVHVPLIVEAPGLRPSRVATPVELVDVAPTLLALAGIAPPRSMRGRDLRPALFGTGALEVTPVFAAVNTRTMALRWPYKLIVDLRYDVRELYDLSTDAGERRNLADRAPEVVTSLLGELRAWIDSLGESTSGRSALARARIGDRAAIPELLAIAHDAHVETSIRVESIRALETFDQTDVRNGLHALVDGPDTAVSDAAAIALGMLGDSRARQRLQDVVSRDDASLRASAAIALARLGDPLGVPTLRDVLTTDDEDQQIAALDGLTRVPDSDALEDLAGALDDEHLRYRAVLALGVSRSPEVWPLLERIADHDREDDVRANAAVALALAHAPGVEARLKRWARLGGEQIYAASALGALGAVGSTVDGWDARAPSGDGWRECRPTGATPAWRLLGARSCVAEREATMTFTVRDANSPARLVVRARGEGVLALGTNHEIARLPLSDADQEWRVPLPAGAFVPGLNRVTVRSDGRVEITHCLVLRDP